MLKKIVTVGLVCTLVLGGSFTVCAEENATVTFTTESKLEYDGVEFYEDGTPKLSTAFEGIAPGETVKQTITMANANDKTVDFYMNADALQALEESAAQARGAGYDIQLSVGDTVLYDSKVGGYANENAAGSSEGILAMNEGALEGYVMVATLAKGETEDINMTIYFDGEAMDNNSQAVDYSNTFGQLGFSFRVSYEEPEGPTVIYNEVVKKGETKYTTKIVEIIEEKVPLASVVTGDNTVLFGGILVLLLGVSMIVFAGKKRNEEE